MHRTPAPGRPPIAVIGMSGRFPMSRDVDEYWRNLCSGRECITFFDDDPDLQDPASQHLEHFVAAGGFLEGIDEFDARFFGYNARDAEGMDPQHRIFLECAWHGLERSGYNPETYPGSIGVYAGSAMSSYLTEAYLAAQDSTSFDHYALAIGNDKDHLATEVSYKLNLRGPSVTVQTACSTSLVAVCMACQSLQDHQCDMALAGGVAADPATGEGYFYQPGSIFSPDGHCRAFDERAAGTVAGNGAGVVVLKRLSDALADGDHVHAVIKGYGVNNDGARKVGYTAPSVDGQAEVIAMAHAMAGVAPETIGYVEAHGTGTPLGDPIEVAALEKAFRTTTSATQFCAIGSVKSNIGHLDTAAGVASLIKTVLVLEKGLVPASLHGGRPNPSIDFESSPFYLSSKLTEWKTGDTPRRAGVSSFGIGGTNAHVVLEEAPPKEHPGPARPYALLTWSARTATAADRATADLADHLLAHPEVDLADVAYTQMVGRKSFEHRQAVVVDRADTVGAGELLRHRGRGAVVTGQVDPRQATSVVFMFPGQGAQMVDMGLGAYQSEPSFRDEVDACCEVLHPLLGLDLRRLIYPTPDQREQAQRQLRQTALTQPALFVVEYALARLWSAWGVHPHAMVGHSLGEYVAACLAGVLSLEDALAVVAERGRLMQLAEPGAMLAVPLPEPALTPYLGDDLSLAAVNGPAACVASGTPAAVSDLAARLLDRGIECQRLRTSHGYHSRLMEPAVGPLVNRLRSVTLRPPQRPFLSNVTGGWITAQAATDPRYWGIHLRRTVRFADQLEQLFENVESVVLLEVGPGRTLCDLARSHPRRRPTHTAVSSLAAPGRQPHDVAALLDARGALWVQGVESPPERLFADERRHRLPLPTYPFEHERYWLDATPGQLDVTQAPARTGAEPVDDGTRPASKEAADLLYRVVWEPAAPPQAGARSGSTDVSRDWLVLHDGGPIGELVAQGLAEPNRRVTAVQPGPRFEAVDTTTVRIRPDDQDDYETLLTWLAERDRLPATVVHLWSLPTDAADTATPTLEEATTRGFLSLVRLTKALECVTSAPVHLDVVTNAVHDVVGDESLRPANATLLGACRVIPQEHPLITCRVIDLDLSVASQSRQAVGSALVSELLESTAEPLVAHRRGRRWLPAVEPVRMDPPPSRRRTRPAGVYLVTGGLGRVGLVHAEHLARTCIAALVLTGRSALPERGVWEQILADPEDEQARRIRSILRLRELGADVTYVCADAADREAMARVVSTATARYGPLNGVIHAAGEPRVSAPIGETDAAVLSRQLHGKARGAQVLADLLHDRVIDPEELDFCLLVSSVSAVLGGAGLASYAAANCYLDALAAAENRRGPVPWTSVNWDAWRFGDTEGQDAGLAPARGEQLIRRILARAPHHVAVSVDDLVERYDRWVRRPAAGPEAAGPLAADDRAEAAAPAAPSRHPRPASHVAYVGPRTPQEQALAGIWEDLLGIAPIGVDDDFFDLGGHSLLAIQLVSRVRQELRHECRVQHVFDAPTVAQLASLVTPEVAPAMPDRDTQLLLETVEQLTDAEARDLLSRKSGHV